MFVMFFFQNKHTYNLIFHRTKQSFKAAVLHCCIILFISKQPSGLFECYVYDVSYAFLSGMHFVFIKLIFFCALPFHYLLVIQCMFCCFGKFMLFCLLQSIPIMKRPFEITLTCTVVSQY